jgi:hypothetical protein
MQPQECHIAVPHHWPGAAELSADPHFGNAEWTLRKLQEIPQAQSIVGELVAATTIGTNTKAREHGKWILIYIAYILSDHADMAKFVLKSSSELWKLAGFEPKEGRPEGREHVPHYNTVHLRFSELEQFVDPVKLAGDAFLRIARANEPRIGQAVHVDATHYSSPSRLRHACTDRDACAKAGRVAATMERASEDDVRAERRKEHTEPEAARTDVPEGLPDNTWIGEDGWRYYELGGHVWKCEDTEASAKTYSNGKSWIGGLDMVATDALVGLPVEEHSFTAREHEFKHYPVLMQGVKRAMGEYPEIVSGDKGHAYRRVYRFNTIRGIASVFPLRRVNAHEPDRMVRRCDAFDEHGVPRCKHCGGPGIQHGAKLGLAYDGRRHVIRFRCQLGITPECLIQIQSVACREDYRMLLPISRLTETYQAMHAAQKNREGIWNARRERWVIGGVDLTGRLKRKGLGVHRLRNTLARVLEWFYLCLRHGWLGAHPYRNPLQPRKRSGLKGVWSTLWARERYGTDLPYGSAAQALGLSDPVLEAEALEAAIKQKQDGRAKRRGQKPPPAPPPAKGEPPPQADDEIPF